MKWWEWMPSSWWDRLFVIKNDDTWWKFLQHIFFYKRRRVTFPSWNSRSHQKREMSFPTFFFFLLVHLLFQIMSTPFMRWNFQNKNDTKKSPLSLLLLVSPMLMMTRTREKREKKEKRKKTWKIGRKWKKFSILSKQRTPNDTMDEAKQQQPKV